MSHKNEHACIVQPKSRFVSLQRVKGMFKGKRLDVIMGKTAKGTVIEQGYRYPIKTWTVKEAANHSKSHYAILFEAATQELTIKDIPYTLHNEPPAVAKVWLREFNSVLKRTGSSLAAKQKADTLLLSWRTRARGQRLAKTHVLLEANVQELEDESLIPQSVIEQAKADGIQKPFFAIFNLGSEGISTGSGLKKVWSFRAIKELVLRIRDSVGSVITKTHTKDNEQRTSIGKLVHAFTRRVGKALHAVGVVLVTDKDTQDKIRGNFYDTCSIDANCVLVREQDNWFVRNVEKFNNLVIANSGEARPGFATAGLVKTIQELQSHRISEMAKDGNEDHIPTLAEVRIAIEQNGWRADQLFDAEDLLQVGEIKDAIDKKIADAIDAKDKHIADLSTKVAAAAVITRNATIDEHFKASKLLADKSDKVIRYVRSQLNIGKDVTEDKMAATVEEAVATELKRMADLGISFVESSKQAAVGVDKLGAASGSDMTDPKHNELIP